MAVPARHVAATRGSHDGLAGSVFFLGADGERLRVSRHLRLAGHAMMIAPLKRRCLTFWLGRYYVYLIWNWPTLALLSGFRWRWDESDPYCYTARIGPIKAHIKHRGCMYEGEA